MHALNTDASSCKHDHLMPFTYANINEERSVCQTSTPTTLFSNSDKIS